MKNTSENSGTNNASQESGANKHFLRDYFQGAEYVDHFTQHSDGYDDNFPSFTETKKSGNDKGLTGGDEDALSGKRDRITDNQNTWNTPEHRFNQYGYDSGRTSYDDCWH